MSKKNMIRKKAMTELFLLISAVVLATTYISGLWDFRGRKMVFMPIKLTYMGQAITPLSFESDKKDFGSTFSVKGERNKVIITDQVLLYGENASGEPIDFIFHLDTSKLTFAPDDFVTVEPVEDFREVYYSPFADISASFGFKELHIKANGEEKTLKTPNLVLGLDNFPMWTNRSLIFTMSNGDAWPALRREYIVQYMIDTDKFAIRKGKIVYNAIWSADGRYCYYISNEKLYRAIF